MSEPWSPYTKRTVILIGLILFALLLWRFRQIIRPLIIAMLLAYVLSPVVDWGVRRLRLGRTLVAALVFLLLIAILIMLPALIVPVVIAQARAIDLDLQTLYATAEAWLDRTVTIGEWSFNVQAIVQDISGNLRSVLSPLATSTLSLVVDVASGLLQTFFILILSFYIVKDAPVISAFFDNLAPPGTRSDVRRLRQEIAQVWSAFFRGQLILCLVIGVVVTAATTAVGLRSSLVMGLLAGALEFIPNLGPIVATIPAVLLALVNGSSWLPMSNVSFAILIIALYIIIQQVENNYLVPRILGDQLNLHPLVVLVGVVAGASLAGILGIFLAAPVLATALALLRYTFRKLQDQDPFPPAPPRKIAPSFLYRVRRRIFKRAARPPSLDQDTGKPAE